MNNQSRSISIDENGDFIGLDVQTSSGLVQSATYGTFFNFRRAVGLPLLDLVSNKGRMPVQPQPVPIGPSSFRSWFQSSQTLSGQQIDELCTPQKSKGTPTNCLVLVSGPERPAPVKRARDVMAQKEKTAPGGTYANSTAAVTASAATAHSDLYNRLTTALSERGYGQ